MTLDELKSTVDTCKKQRLILDNTCIEIVVMMDEMKTQDVSYIKSLYSETFGDVRIINSESCLQGPGRLWNKGYSLSSGELIVFTWTGVYWHQDSLFHLIGKITEGAEAAFGTAYITSDYNKEFELRFKGLLPDLIYSMNGIPLGYTLIKREAVELLGGFCDNTQLAPIADWEFLIRLASQFKTEAILGNPISIKTSLGQLFKNYPFIYTIDESIRYFITKTYVHFSNLMDYQSKENIKCIINPDEFMKKEGCKIAVISGILENAQVQLCISNYLEILCEYDIFSWRRFLEGEIKPEKLQNYDLVFFVRCRSGAAVSAAKYCRENNIKTIYLLDDNWFCITDTYPQLEKQMGKMSEGHHLFNTLIDTVDYIVVYNEVLANDLEEYGGKVIKLPVNVNSSHFFTSIGKDTKSTINIGFAGTQSKMQHFQEAFKAIERIMTHFENINFYIKGIQLPATFAAFGERIIQEAYTFDYKKYARAISNWHCDIMISPLDDTKYTNSKCPNKYLEITAAGAAGLYSDTQLYRKIISNKYNGLIISNNEKEWYQALKLLIEDSPLREHIIKNARKEISKKYETKVVLPEFIAMLEKILGRDFNIKF